MSQIKIEEPVREKSFENNIFEIHESENPKLYPIVNEDCKSIRSVGSNTSDKNVEPKSFIKLETTKEFKTLPKVYSELEILRFNGEEKEEEDTEKYEWKVVSRWIKYEQSVNQTTNKWDEPYVGPLLYQELIYLKNSLISGTIILNSHRHNIENVFEDVLDDFVNRGQVVHYYKEKLKKIILSQYRSQRAFFGVLTGRKNLRPDSLKSTVGNSRLISVNSFAQNLSSAKGNLKERDKMTSFEMKTQPIAEETDVEKPHVFYIGSETDTGTDLTANQKDFQTKMIHLKDRYTHHTEKSDEQTFEVESFLIMAGEVPFLTRHVTAFVKMVGDNFIYDLDGFRMKIRYIFVFLGPKSQFSYLEIGRCMGNLMNNKDFKAAVYHAKTSHELIKAITNYSNHSLCLVLPKGNFNEDLLKTMTEWVQRKMKAKKKRNKAIEMNAKSESTQTKQEESHMPSDDDEDSDASEFCEDDSDKPDPFKPTGCLFGAMIKETKYRYSQYWSDIKDGVNFKCLCSTIFIFTICLAPTLTFGGILADKTKDWFGVNEMLIATAANGLFFGLFSGQPLMIFGPTGPMVVFEEMLYIFCIKTFQIDLLATRIWVSIWIFIISLLVVGFESVRVIQYVTRFTEEIFATLIACNFLLDVVKKSLKYFMKNPLYTTEIYCDKMKRSLNDGNKTIDECYFAAQNGTSLYDLNCHNSNLRDEFNVYHHKKHYYPQANIALISVIILILTCFLALIFKKLRLSNLLASVLRRTISDVGLLLTIVTMILVDYLIRVQTKIETQKLDIPDEFMPTYLARTSWFVSPFGNNYGKNQLSFDWWIPICSFLPAFLIFTILFFEVELIGILLANPHRKLKKGTGFNLDLILGSLMMVMNSFFGLPWLCAAPVRTVAHWASLTTYTQSHIPGEKNKLMSVKEQRVTGILVHIGIGLCLAAKFFLRQIPVPALFGILFYFGITNLSGTQLWDRILFTFTPFQDLPNLCYARGVRVIKRNMFTILQIVSVAILLVFKSIAIVSFFFPIFLVFLVILRNFVLPKFYSARELEQLDEEEEQTVDVDDFYALTHLGW